MSRFSPFFAPFLSRKTLLRQFLRRPADETRQVHPDRMIAVSTVLHLGDRILGLPALAQNAVECSCAAPVRSVNDSLTILVTDLMPFPIDAMSLSRTDEETLLKNQAFPKRSLKRPSCIILSEQSPAVTNQSRQIGLRTFSSVRAPTKSPNALFRRPNRLESPDALMRQKLSVCRVPSKTSAAFVSEP